MVRHSRRKAVDPSLATKYHTVARALRRSAMDLCDLAEEGDLYGNAVGIIAIHAAIAYGDALCIAFGHFKSTEGQHERAVEALRDALGSRAGTRQLKELRAIIAEKDAVAYQGVYYSIADARTLVERLQRFAEWAEDLYERRP